MNLISPFLYGSVCTSILYLLDKWIFKKDRNFFFYLTMFLLVFAINYVSKAQAEFVPDAKLEISMFRHDLSLTPEQLLPGKN